MDSEIRVFSLSHSPSQVLFCFVLPIIQGETSKDCLVSIIDDSLYEHEEKFYVTVLSHLGSRINNRRNTTVVVISPDQKDGKTGN